MAYSRPLEPDAPPEQGTLERVALGAPVGLFQADCTGAIIFATPRFFQILGLDRNDGLGSEWLRAILPADRARLEAAWCAVIEEGGAGDFHAQLAADSARTVRILLAPLGSEIGAVSFTGAVSDITQLTSRVAELSASRDRFREFADAMPHFAWIAAPDGSIEYFNRPWLDYTALTVERMRATGTKHVVHPQDLNLTWSRWSSALSTGKPFEIEYRLRNARDGTYRWFIARSVPIRDESGTILKWIGTATDVDQQVRANANLRFALDATAALTALLDVEAVCNELARLAIASVADWCFITLLQEDGRYETISIAHRNPARIRYVEQFRGRYPIERGSAVDKAIRKNLSLLMPTIDPESVRRAATDAEHLTILQNLAMHSIMIVPIGTEANRALGAITLVSSESGHSFSNDDLAVVEMVARRAASAIGTAKSV